NKKILVRKNFAEYPAKNGRPAYRHDDLLIIFIDGETKRPRAIYFDTEGHTIRYGITAQDRSLIFESERSEPFPHYRFTYVPDGAGNKGRFEVQPAGEPRYKTYIDFTARKK